MRKHVRVWFASRKKKPGELCLCEFHCCNYVVDVHHIKARGMGGSKLLDTPDNLIGLCRLHHDEAEAGRITKAQLRQRVKEILGI